MKIFAVVLTVMASQGIAAPLSENEANELAPGHLCTVNDRDFVEFRYEERIPYCKRNVSAARKEAIKRRWRIPENQWPDYQIDHVNSLALGGSNAEANLMPLHYDVHSEKEHIEGILFALIKRGQVSQSLAVKMLADWRHICVHENHCDTFNICVDEWVSAGAPTSFTCSL